MTEKNESCCNFFPAFLKYFNMSAREHGTQGGGGKECVCVCVCSFYVPYYSPIEEIGRGL